MSPWWPYLPGSTVTYNQLVHENTTTAIKKKDKLGEAEKNRGNQFLEIISKMTIIIVQLV